MVTWETLPYRWLRDNGTQYCEERHLTTQLYDIKRSRGDRYNNVCFFQLCSAIQPPILAHLIKFSRRLCIPHHSSLTLHQEIRSRFLENENAPTAYRTSKGLFYGANTRATYSQLSGSQRWRCMQSRALSQASIQQDRQQSAPASLHQATATLPMIYSAAIRRSSVRTSDIKTC